MYQKRNFEILPISALEKVRGHLRPQLFENENTALLGERCAFQVAFRAVGYGTFNLSYRLDGVNEGNAEVFMVREVPCTYPVAASSDDYVLTTESCVMPDLLTPVTYEGAGIVTRDCYWQAFYIRLQGLPAGRHSLTFSLFNEEQELLGEVNYNLEILPHILPESDLTCSYWIHYDSIADYYQFPVFSEEYNKYLRAFVCNAVKNGLTTLLTPLFTPALDTAEGKERMTVQLVEVCKTRGEYSFDFTKLGWFMSFAKECGVQYFEMSHLFTQWGAKYTPKIMAMVDGEERRIFGWDTEALSEEYRAFLAAFLPCLRSWLIENGYYDYCCFHISDEPKEWMFEQYKACSTLVRQYLPDATFADAMSNCEYVEEGLLNMPFVATSATDAFIEKDIKDYYVYYCTTQRGGFLSNRFLSMPLERTRILGLQMYLNNVRGFLHWGYNYYYSYLSKEAINPFAVTDCMGRYQSGDSFIVYPGKEGVLETIRIEAFYQGLQDYRALKALEQKIGRERVCDYLQKNGMGKNFHDYPKSAGWLLSLRRDINRLLLD